MKRWGIKVNNEISEYDFFHEVFMIQCENGFLVSLAKEYPDGWLGLGKFCMHMRSAYVKALNSQKPMMRQYISVPTEMLKEMEQQLQQSEDRIQYLEMMIEKLRKAQSENARPNDEEEVERLFEAANLKWAAGGSSSQAFQQRHHAIDEALQRQEDDAAARARYELRRDRERRTLRPRARRRSNR